MASRSQGYVTAAAHVDCIASRVMYLFERRVTTMMIMTVYPCIGGVVGVLRRALGVLHVMMMMMMTVCGGY